MLFRKDAEGRFELLKDSGEKIETFIGLFNDGKTSYSGEIAMKLRLLLAYKSGTKSLLKQVCDDLNVDFFVYDDDMSEDLEELRALGGVRGELSSEMFWFFSGDDKDAVPKCSIFKAIEHKNYWAGDSELSLKCIFEAYSDQCVAHADTEYRGALKKFMENEYAGDFQSTIGNALVKLGEAIVRAIDILIKYKENREESKFIVRR